jgi:hypothetical protein
MKGKIAMSSRSKLTSHPAAPWWSFAHVWMVIAGPAVVVVASFITLYLAIRSPNTVLDPEPALQTQPGIQGSVQGRANMAPAMLARNHAATGVNAPRPSAAGAVGNKP